MWLSHLGRNKLFYRFVVLSTINILLTLLKERKSLKWRLSDMILPVNHLFVFMNQNVALRLLICVFLNLNENLNIKRQISWWLEIAGRSCNETRVIHKRSKRCIEALEIQFFWQVIWEMNLIKSEKLVLQYKNKI